MRVLTRRLRPDSGGAVEFRGGLGQEIISQNQGAEPIGVAIVGSRTEIQARGIFGGRDGVPRIFKLNGTPLEAKGNYQLGQHDILKVVDAGGGGYGEPRLRDQTRITADLVEGFVKLDGARRDYGFDG